MSKRVVRLAIACVFIFASPVFAKEGLRIGIGMGASFPGFEGSITDAISPENGMAFMADMGYGFTNALSLNVTSMASGGVADADFTIYDYSWAWVGYGLDARYEFMADRKISPFVLAGFGVSMVVLAPEKVKELTVVTDPAIGVNVGCGVNYDLNDNWSLAALAVGNAAKYTGAQVTVNKYTYEIDNDTGGGIINVLFTINYTFSEKKNVNNDESENGGEVEKKEEGETDEPAEPSEPAAPDESAEPATE